MKASKSGKTEKCCNCEEGELLLSMKPKKQDNREALLNCALHMFYCKGYDAVSVQEIVDAAGITKPTLYHYFKSKHGVLESLLAEKGHVVNENMKCAARIEGDIETVLKNVIRAQEMMAGELKELYLFMLGSYFSSNENVAKQVVAPFMIEQFKIIQDIFVRFFEDIEDAQKECYAVEFAGMMHYYILMRIQKREEEKKTLLSDDEMIDRLIKQFLYGIQKNI